MQITEILARNARMYGDKTALIERIPETGERHEISWGQFYAQANAVANFLRGIGIRKGDRVVQLMTNCIEWLPIYFGILQSGATAVPLNFRFTAEDILRCSGLCEAKAFVFGPEFIERVNAVKSSLDETVQVYLYAGPDPLCPSYGLSCNDLLSSGDTSAVPVAIEPCDRAGIYFTSGTTGAPKGVFLKHRQLEAACYVENRHHNQTHQDNFLCIPPLYHTGAKMHWFGNFIVGAKSVLLRGVTPRAVLDAVSEEGVTIVWLLVPWAHDIIMAIENQEIDLANYRLDQWRLMHIGAQPVPPSLIRKWKTYFPHQAYDTNYGLTEATGPGCVHLGVENVHKIGAIGVAGFDWECRIVDEKGGDLPSNVPGELLVKGPGVMAEYYKNPEATALVLKNGWLHTGDIVKKDGDGFLWLVDRKKDVVISGGENIFPVEIENFLMDHDDIMDAAVIGLPDERLGEIVAAVIAVKNDRTLTEDDIFSYCRGLPRYQRPRRIFLDAVPRNATGKIEKPRLRKKYC